MSFLFDRQGSRKYLTICERRAFLRAAQGRGHRAFAFCATLAYTGARISEVLELVPRQIDWAEGVLVFECLKKRRRGIYRTVPVPADLLKHLSDLSIIGGGGSDSGIWGWRRTTGWRLVKSVMADAGIRGPQATPKGLRHGFAVTALQQGLPLNMVRKWLGHSRLSTTAIYADAMGPEEQAIAERLWKAFDPV